MYIFVDKYKNLVEMDIFLGNYILLKLILEEFKSLKLLIFIKEI